jgi:hypothetical protein
MCEFIHTQTGSERDPKQLSGSKTALLRKYVAPRRLLTRATVSDARQKVTRRAFVQAARSLKKPLVSDSRKRNDAGDCSDPSWKYGAVFSITKRKEDRYVFRVPILRNVAKTDVECDRSHRDRRACDISHITASASLVPRTPRFTLSRCLQALSSASDTRISRARFGMTEF